LGGNEKSLYYISAGFIKQDGIVKPSSFERMNFPMLVFNFRSGVKEISA